MPQLLLKSFIGILVSMQEDSASKSLQHDQSTCENQADRACGGGKGIAADGALNKDLDRRRVANSEPAIAKNLLDACIHCGLCLPACPTYLATVGSESPRGRIYLLNQWQTGQQGYSSRLAEHIDSCLGCLGCQTACPSGVNYEGILGQARVALTQKRDRRLRIFLRWVFQQLLPDNKRLQFFGGALRLWQKLRLRKILQLFVTVVPVPPLKRLAGLEAYLPGIAISALSSTIVANR